MFTLRPGPLVGLMVQVALLAALARTVGLGPGGWLTGLIYGLGTCLLLHRALGRRGIGSPAGRFGLANSVTLARATLAGAVAALVADSWRRPAPVSVLVGLTAIALGLDALDGQLARRTATASAFGARFDLETDAFLILVLSCYLARTMGVWVVSIGAMRYAFVAAGWALPWLRATLAPRRWRKVVAAIQGIVLACAAADVLPRPLSAIAVAIALALLVESFGRDIGWLWHYHGAAALRRPGREPV